MPEAGTFTYRAFLSYSHRDREWGEWLHRGLETYQVPKEIIGQQRAPGPVPAKLRPIFRDREDLEAGHSLREQVVAALQASEALIVVCSPHAAKSAYVNEEIRQFKSLGRAHRIFPIIVDGIPGDAEKDCFPGTLRRQLAPDNSLTDQIEEPLAADAREEGDGKDLALLKVIAGLIGIDLDEIRRREAIELRRRQRRSAMIAGVMTVLAVAAGALAWVAFVQRNHAVAAEKVAQERRAEAERRYEQALDTTLRLVTTAATFRSVLDNQRFDITQVETKGESDDFQEFLRSSKQPDDVWFRLVKVLIAYEQNLPPELRRMQPRLETLQMRKQWLQHAEIILVNLSRRHPEQTEYAPVLADIRNELARLGS